MNRINGILSFILVIIMIATASVTVNKSLLGFKIGDTEKGNEVTEKAEAGNMMKSADGSVVINTKGMKGTVNGYAGPVPLEIYITDGKITEIKPLENSETPAFFNRASVILDQWKGRTPEEGRALKVDGVSGATYSSQAIISNVKAGLDTYLGSKGNHGTAMPWKLWVALAVTLLAAVVPIFVHNRIYHNVQMILNIVVLGFWCGQYLDYALVLKYMSSGFLFPAGLIAIVMLITAFIYPLFGRPQHYCNYICPLGSAQQLTAQICKYKIHISKRVLNGLDWFRRILWGVLMFLLWIDTFTGWMDYELFQAFMVESAPWYIIMTAGIFIALSAIVARPYCRFVCPIGSLIKRSENMG
ncbi:MAG: FMN-binding protein [Muribaculaceae bacterium]|nr:FMN-binding protein [Muribaculaceae bacterium]